MDGHSHSFSFVDRITSLDPGVSIRGHYSIPPNLESFPVSLVAEAVGQLAAWAAMAAVGFSHRPVAGIAGSIELLSFVRPGQRLDLAAELESVDDEMVGYGGTAKVDGVPVLRLLNCVGPMMPLEEFDEPQALCERLGFLQTVGASSGGFAGLPVLALERGEGELGRLARATLQVPVDAPFFADHFPRRPVFPGTLLMHANLEIAARLTSEVACVNEGAWVPRGVSNVKLRSFISPGDTLHLEARVTAHSATSLSVAMESLNAHRLVGSADILFSSEVKS